MCKKLKNHLKKSFSLLLVLGISFSSIIPFPVKVVAQETRIGKISGENVRFRSKPTTENEANGSNNILFELEEGASVTIINTDKITGPGCSEGWFNVSYGEYVGYVCSKYVKIDGYDIYDRPWTTPKKAIIGGARFIGKSYISKGQFTSYLKKFNVNPKGYYQIYNHLYMSNIMAPSSEALSSYNAYKDNGLFDLPLEFNIPVYNKMDDEYELPGGNLVDIDTIDEVEDEEFEKLLDEEEFPDSYRGALRYLHKKHPNWTFKSMITDLRFPTAVANFQLSSAVKGKTRYYEKVGKQTCENDYRGKSKDGYCQTEAEWYVPNKDTLGYYLDPRNFLTEKYILQFESLEYSKNYTESVVASILKGTFMDGISILDTQSYASIFAEAGKNENVSSVYLASLAKQEVGVNGSISTSGAEFEYEGETYSGLFNFFNIGAYSNASSPVKAGLVYASGDVCKKCSSNEVYKEVEEFYKLDEILKDAGYKVSGDYVYDFSVGEKVSKIEDKLDNDDIEIKAGKVIGTGDKIKLNGETYIVVLYGDVTGDGEINSSDLLKIRQYLLGMTSLSSAAKEAAKVTGGKSISSSDLLKVRQYLLGMTRIKQG